MATIATYTLTDRPTFSQTILSGDAQSADIVEITSPVDVPWPTFLAHCFLSVRFFDAGGLPVTPSAGTMTIEIQTLGNQPNWEDPPAPTTIDATAPTTLDWAANTYGIRVTPAGLTGVDHWAVFAVFNQS